MHVPLLVSMASLACSKGDSGQAHADSGADGIDPSADVDSSANTDQAGDADDAHEQSSDVTPSAADEGDKTDAGDDGLKFDLGEVPDFIVSGHGCEKVDFLFVIDNSGSMEDEQANLLRSFPGFMEAIEDTLEINDFHVMAVDTDAAGSGGSTSSSCNNGVCTCTPAPRCCEQICNGQNDSCNGMDCDMLDDDACNITLGAGKIHNSMTGAVCSLKGEDRFITSGQMDLSDVFSCTARMGTLGDTNEQPMRAMVDAVGPVLNGTGGCNAGFVRDDAVLVVTIITDEEDQGKSPGTPAQWKQQLVTAKLGNEAAIVVIGLIGDRDLPSPICGEFMDTTGAEPAPNLRRFVRSFADHGLDASVCADDYRPYFEEAVGIIDVACKDFDPPG